MLAVRVVCFLGSHDGPRNPLACNSAPPEVTRGLMLVFSAGQQVQALLAAQVLGEPYIQFYAGANSAKTRLEHGLHTVALMAFAQAASWGNLDRLPLGDIRRIAPSTRLLFCLGSLRRLMPTRSWVFVRHRQNSESRQLKFACTTHSQAADSTSRSSDGQISSCRSLNSVKHT